MISREELHAFRTLMLAQHASNRVLAQVVSKVVEKMEPGEAVELTKNLTRLLDAFDETITAVGSLLGDAESGEMKDG